MTTSQHVTTFPPYPGNPAQVYERHFVPVIALPFATPVVEAAYPGPGDRVLDVACGTGVAARLAAQRVGEHGRVAGIDSNPVMLEVAASSTPAGSTIEWQQASADGLPFPDDSFDVVLCSLGLQFFPDKAAALAEVRRVLTAGGRVAIGVPGPTPRLFEDLHEVLAEHLGTDVAEFVRTVFSAHEPGRLRSMMAVAGLDDVDVESRQVSVRLPSPAEFFWQYLLSTPLAMSVSGLDDAERAALERDILNRWQPLADATGMDCLIGLTLATAGPRRRTLR